MTGSQPLFGTASTTDLLTAAKSIANNLLQAAQTYQNIQGAKQAAAISTATTLSSGTGRLVNVIVTTAGVGAGSVKDGSNVVFTIPTTTGVYLVNIPTNYGISVSPGTGQVVTVSYS